MIPVLCLLCVVAMATATATTRLERLNAWVETTHIQLNGVALFDTQGAQGIGLKATRELGVGETILKVPMDLVLWCARCGTFLTWQLKYSTKQRNRSGIRRTRNKREVCTSSFHIVRKSQGCAV